MSVACKNNKKTKNMIAFEINTVPDLATARCLFNLGDLEDKGVISAMTHLHRQKNGDIPLPPYLQRIDSISMARLSFDTAHFSVTTFKQTTEQKILQNFYQNLSDDNNSDFICLNKNILTYRTLKYLPIIKVKPNFNANLVYLLSLLDSPISITGNILDEIAVSFDLPKSYHDTEPKVVNIVLIYMRLQLLQHEITFDHYTKNCTLIKQVLTMADNENLSRFNMDWKI